MGQADNNVHNVNASAHIKLPNKVNIPVFWEGGGEFMN